MSTEKLESEPTGILASPSASPSSLREEPNHTQNTECVSVTAALSDLTFETERIATINTIHVPEMKLESASDDSVESANEIQHSPSQQNSFTPKQEDTKEETDPWKDFKPASQERKDKIIKQLEFYFSDANVLKDVFLLKHIRRNKQGFVSMKLITSFKKMKSLTKDWRQVADSIKDSEKLVLNKEWTKVKRKYPLPERNDEETSSRTVVGFNLPLKQPSIEQLLELFGPCGEITLIRILKPDVTVPPDIAPFCDKHPEIGRTLCALIEYDKTESAVNACKTLSDTSNWRTGMRVISLGKVKLKKDVKTADGSEQTETESHDGKKKKKKRQCNKKLEVVQGSEFGHGTTSGSDAEQLPSRPRSGSNLSVDGRHLTPYQSPRNSPRSSPRLPKANKERTALLKTDGRSRESSPDVWRRGSGDGSASNSPWIQRRRLLAAAGCAPMQGSPGGSPLIGRKNPDGSVNSVVLIRPPVGVDEVPAFYGGMGRDKARSQTSPI